jgi:hypothetical protein
MKNLNDMLARLGSGKEIGTAHGPQLDPRHSPCHVI